MFVSLRLSPIRAIEQISNALFLLMKCDSAPQGVILYGNHVPNMLYVVKHVFQLLLLFRIHISLFAAINLLRCFSHFFMLQTSQT